MDAFDAYLYDSDQNISVDDGTVIKYNKVNVNILNNYDSPTGMIMGILDMQYLCIHNDSKH